jgi:hypothetical protein
MTKSQDDNAQIHDSATETMSGSEVANAAAETLHGEHAAEEARPQPDATVLPAGGGTLIAQDPPGEPEPKRSDR